MIKDYLKITWKNVKNRKIRAWLTILGVVIGIGAIVALYSISQGLENAVEESFSSLGISNIRITAPDLTGPPSGETGVPTKMIDVVEGIKGVDYANPILFSFDNIEYANEEVFTAVLAQDPDKTTAGFADSNTALYQGRYLKGSDNYAVLIGYDVAYDLFDKEVKIRSSIKIGDDKFKVIGILEKTGTGTDDNIIIPIDIAREVYQRFDLTNLLLVALEPGEDKDELVKRIETRLEKSFDSDEYDVFTPEQLLEQFTSILGIVQAFLVAIAAISLLVGGLGIMNSMYTSVLERTREIGIFKAIGASNESILTIFLIESGIIGMLGGTVGALLGSLFAYMTQLIAEFFDFGLLSVRVSPLLIFSSISFAFIVGMISGVLPAWRASRLKPVDALREE